MTSINDPEQLVFVGFNSRIAALDRRNGVLIWSWKSPNGAGFVAIVRDGSQLFVSVQGYTYCLDACTGQMLWQNLLGGFGYGTPCLAVGSGSSLSYSSSAELEAQSARTSTGS